MSFLDPPRLHFAGTFFTNPSTINNATENYDPAAVYNNQPPSDTNPTSVWWNKDGQAFFKIPSADPVHQNAGYVPPAQIHGIGVPFCEVTSARDNADQPLSGDPILTARIVSVVTGDLAGQVNQNLQYARIVDLDPDQQARSLIVGLRIQITLPDDPGVSLAGTAWPMTIQDLWGRVVGGSGGGIFTASCAFQSVLDELEWSGIDGTGSGFLKQLYAASPERLSLKFVIDGYNGNLPQDSFGRGRMVGTIGPYFAGEPLHVLAERKLFPNSTLAAPNSPLNPAPFEVWHDRLILDLANSIPSAAILAGPFVDVGTVEAIIDPLGANLALSPPLFTSVAEYTTQYYTAAGIFDVPLTADQATLLANRPLALRVTPPARLTSAVTGKPAARLKEGLTVAQSGASPQPGPAGPSLALAERADGLLVQPDLSALRIEVGAPPWSSDALDGTGITAEAQVPLIATLWGVPKPDLPLTVKLIANQYQFVNAEGQPYDINNDPLSAIQVNGVTPGPSVDQWPGVVVQTGPDGRAAVTFTAGSLSADMKPARRRSVDGQLYLFTHDYSMDGIQPITVLLFDDQPVASAPTWWQDVRPVLYQYARLYPFMRGLIDLSDYGSVTNTELGFMARIQFALQLPTTHPGFMPVTRDLSLRNRTMILTWYQSGAPQGTQP